MIYKYIYDSMIYIYISYNLYMSLEVQVDNFWKDVSIKTALFRKGVLFIIISGNYSFVFDLQIFQGRIHNPTNWGPFVTPLLKILESSQLPTSTTHVRVALNHHDERQPQVLNGGHGRR